MNHVNSWITVFADVYWFVRYPIMCFAWFYLGSIGPDEHPPGMNFLAVAAAVIWTLIATNVSV